MAKYCGCLDIADVCKLELEKMREILAKYKVEKEDAEAIEGMLTEAYYQLLQSSKCGRILDELLVKRMTRKEIMAEFIPMMCEPDKYDKKFAEEILDQRGHGEDEEEC